MIADKMQLTTSMQVFQKIAFLLLALCLMSSYGPQLYALKKSSYHKPHKRNVQYRVAVCIVATGIYEQLSKDLITSIRRFFLKQDHVDVFLLTDQHVLHSENLYVIQCAFQGWPHDSLMRCALYERLKQKLMTYDFVYAIDADVRICKPIGREVLGSLVAVVAPRRVYGSSMPFEDHVQSSSYIPIPQKQYYTSKVYGAVPTLFFQMQTAVKNLIEKDQRQFFIARRHDESYINRFFFDCKPSLVLMDHFTDKIEVCRIFLKNGIVHKEVLACPDS